MASELTRNWRRAVGTAWRAFGSNKYCWIGATIGMASIFLFDWIHLTDPVRTHWPFALQYWAPDPYVDFSDLIGRPGAFIFLVGTVLACVSYLGGLVQTAGFALILVYKESVGHWPYANSHLELGFYLALVSVFFVLVGWGLRLKNGQVRAYHSRLAAMSPRLGLFAR